MKNIDMNRARRLEDIARLSRGFHPADRWSWARAIGAAAVGIILAAIAYETLAADLDAGEAHATYLEQGK